MDPCVHYLCTARHTYTLGIFAAFYAAGIAPRIRILTYRRLPAIRSFGPGPFIFSDLDRLNASYRHGQAELADWLVDKGGTVLNHPARVLLRFPLLRTLHERGINRFNVYRVSEWQRVRRFPVFLRAENVHGQALSGLLHDRAALQRALSEFSGQAGALDTLMIVEFGNVPGSDGKYRKYAAFRVGGTIYAQHCYASADWWVRFESSATTPAEWAEHDAYARNNPHRAQLEPIFALAGIDYGRIDYAVIDDQVQVFEINTNPTIIHAGSHRLINVEPYALAHRQALTQLLDGFTGPKAIANPVASADVAAATPDELHEKVLAFTRKHWGARTHHEQPQIKT